MQTRRAVVAVAHGLVDMAAAVEVDNGSRQPFGSTTQASRTEAEVLEHGDWRFDRGRC